ncbi:hypothetical protein CEUSTIGMA_g12120.t1 [Chlamydomonas eustigma]|uniref:Uncharacterized protein n=1 Tax=Chlamydomonas eustigma TaxID=1157962 RepID=A0A250XNQ2_9CHLO|nr:hypothetical protein CEUSTIGMA_g12120.t1 [Chlamydomonas eustigma]|eukprot:GAX84698.1 hypothetical protein CEUSTIGMA_g12120.t1 [Chlamydomonas eustigma]
MLTPALRGAGSDAPSTARRNSSRAPESRSIKKTARQSLEIPASQELEESARQAGNVTSVEAPTQATDAQQQDIESDNKSKDKSAAAPSLTWAQTVIVLMQALAIYLTLIPFIVAIALKDAYFMYGILFGVVFSGLLVAVNAGLWFFKYKKEMPIMGTALVLEQSSTSYATYENDPGTIPSRMMLRALQHAKEATPEIAWNAPSFRSVVDHVAGVWAGVEAICSLLCVVPYRLGSTGMSPLNIVFNYVFPYLMLIVLLALTRWWPRYIRIIHYLPRMMHQGAVQPGGTNKEEQGLPTTEGLGPASQVAGQEAGTIGLGGDPGGVGGFPVGSHSFSQQGMIPGPATPFQQGMIPGPATPFQQGTPQGLASPYQQAMPPAPTSPYQQGMPPAPNSPYQQAMPPAPSSPYQQGMYPAPTSPYQQGMPPAPNSPYQQGMPPAPNSPYQQGMIPGLSSPSSQGMTQGQPYSYQGMLGGPPPPY